MNDEKIQWHAQGDIEGESNRECHRDVKAGIGIKNELRNKDLQIISVKGLPISTTWNLIWLKLKALSPAAEAFLDYIKEEKDGIIADQFSWIKDY